ncbi:MAG: helix-turn-helix domain-containing protein [Anaerolineaceae bacterium]|nr:helix-turn-helix domain-containing protein [Anaerolineaceae bacterium]
MNRKSTGTTIDALMKGGLPTLNQGRDQFQPFSTERLYDTEEASAYLRVEPRTIGKFIASGKLSASWVGRRWLVPESSLSSFVQGQQKDRAVTK